MYKIFCYLIIALIAFTGLTCASAACDAENITVDEGIDDVIITDLNQDIDNNNAVDENNNDDLNQDINNITLDENNPSTNTTELIKLPCDLNTKITENEKGLFYHINYDLNCTGNYSLKINAGNETCLNGNVKILKSNVFVNEMSWKNQINVSNNPITFTISICYDGDTNHYPTMLSQTIVVEPSMTKKFVVRISDLIAIAIMCVN